MTLAAGPSPPADYPIVVVGSGPGALQLTYCLTRLGIRHAVISQDSGPGGMFRKWPLFQRLLSSTKPYAPGGRGSRNFERLDWNSLLAEEPEARALQASHMDGTSNYPSRAEMEANLAEFAERTGLIVRYGCQWESTRIEDAADGRRFVIATSDGEYRCRIAIFAVGVAEPWVPPIPGIELAHHYAQVRAPETYAGKRVFIIGKHNSGFEIATGLLSWAAGITLCSPSPAKLSVTVKSLVGVRARYSLPFEDHALGGGVNILDGSIERIERAEGALRIAIRTTAGSQAMSFIADEVINVTGFVAPLRDLPKLGVATFGQSALPAQTAWWESATVPGIHFAGTITQGVSGLSKHGIPPNSGAVQGFRYNARLLARRLAETEFGIAIERPALSAGQAAELLIGEAACGPELWHQKGFLAHAISLSERNGIRDEGVVPLAAFLDEAKADGAAVTVEADGTGAIYPVVYVRRGGATRETVLPGNALLDFSTPEHVDALNAALAPLALG